MRDCMLIRCAEVRRKFTRGRGGAPIFLHWLLLVRNGMHPWCDNHITEGYNLFLRRIKELEMNTSQISPSVLLCKQTDFYYFSLVDSIYSTPIYIPLLTHEIHLRKR